jgi:MFS transporter, DHA2 family, multidrug resistance protein
LFNLMRNIGGSVGIAAVTTMLARREQFHQVQLIPHLSLYDPQYQRLLQEGVAGLVGAGQPYWQAQQQAVGLAYASVIRQATTMAFIDCFWLLAVAVIVIMPLVLILRRPPRTAHPRPAGH